MIKSFKRWKRLILADANIALILYPKTRPVILNWAFGLMDEMIKLMQKFLN